MIVVDGELRGRDGRKWVIWWGNISEATVEEQFAVRVEDGWDVRISGIC